METPRSQIISKFVTKNLLETMTEINDNKFNLLSFHIRATRPISVTHTHHKGKHYDNDAFEHIVYVELES